MTGSIDRGGMDVVRPRRGFAFLSALAGASLMLAACEGGEQAQPTSTTTTTEAPAPSGGETNPCPSPPVVPVEGVTFTFDDLGGGEPTIFVYCGTGETPTDKASSGLFNNGDEVGVVCKDLDGRTVPPDPDAGEVGEPSDDWVRIAGTPGVKQNATMTYGKLSPPDAMSLLPDCK